MSGEIWKKLCLFQSRLQRLDGYKYVSIASNVDSTINIFRRDLSILDITCNLSIMKV